MKLLFTLLLLIISIQLNNSTFLSNKCIGAGETCRKLVNRCQKGYTCQLSDEKDSESKTICKPVLKLGEKCPSGAFQSDICENGLECYSRIGDNSSDTYCDNHYFAGVNEKCRNEKDCKGYSVTCSNGICIFDKKTWPGNQKCRLPYSCEGQSYCTSTGCDLDEKKYCKNPQCKPLEKSGSNCIDSRDCSLGTFCLRKEAGEYGKCVDKYTSKLNQSCNSDRGITLECDIGLVCNNNNTCVTRLITSPTKNCLSNGCNEYNDEYCDIVSNQCKFKTVYSQQCKEAEKQRNQCYQLHNCPYSNLDDSSSPFSTQSKLSCMIKNCDIETNNYHKQCSSLFNDQC